jgi:type IX secretion system PorP/SprF family membrane protein
MRIFTVLILLFIGFAAKSQDIPLFSQKLTNSFIYNPAMAGIGLGSFTLSHRNNYSGVRGAPSNNFLSLHTPFSNYRFGTGFNVFQEEVAAVKSIYASGAFAYHINLNSLSSLSFGVSGEYNNTRLTDEVIAQNDGSDVILNRYSSGVAQPDFSFGMAYQNRVLKMGISANRLYTAWFEKDSTQNLANYYSGFLQGTIPVQDGRGVIEPYVAYRKFSESNNVLDLGVYYTYDNKLTAGVATRSGSILNATLGYKLTKNLMVGYSREMIMGSVGGYTGSSNEFVLRLDFADRANKKHFRADYKNAMNYRKKSVTNASLSSSKKTVGSRSPQQAHKAQKKLAPYSPSKRYQNTKALAGKKTSTKMKSSSSKKFSTSYNKYGSKKKKQGAGAFKKNKYNPVRKKKRR